MAQAQLSKIERGRKSPTLDTYSRLLAALDAEVPLPHVTDVTVGEKVMGWCRESKFRQ